MRKEIPLESPLSCPGAFTKLGIIDVNWKQVDLIMRLYCSLWKKMNLGSLKLQMESNLEKKMNISCKELDIILKHFVPHNDKCSCCEYYFL